MRTQILIKKSSIVWVFMLLLGFFLFFSGMDAYNKYKCPMEFENLNLDNLKKGMYVSGNIRECVKKNLAEVGPAEYSGVSCVHSAIGKEYDIYTVPLADNTYIRVMISDPDTKNRLRKLVNSEQETVYFEGEIAKFPMDDNYAWYQDIEGFDEEALEAGYVIKQEKIGEVYKRVYPGITILGLCIYLLMCGSLKGAISKEVIYMESY